MIMQGFGLQPIPVLSPQQMQDSIGVESKVFSIYARGYVKSGKRETNVHVHAVVDFRGALTPEQVMQQNLQNLMNQANPGAGTAGAGGTSGAPPGAQPGAAAQPGSLPPGAGPGAIMQALKPGSGGNVVYYQVD
jgi:hypothetical protein